MSRHAELYVALQVQSMCQPMNRASPLLQEKSADKSQVLCTQFEHPRQFYVLIMPTAYSR